MSAPAASTIEAIRRPRSLLRVAHSVFHVITEMLTIGSLVMAFVGVLFTPVQAWR
jgi:hypothetical protein